jgi:hypothetical protein
MGKKDLNKNKPDKEVVPVKGKLHSFASHLKNKSPKRVQPYLTKRNFVIAIIIIFFLSQYLQIRSITGGFSILDLKGSSLVDEVGSLSEALSMVGKDLNEVRSFLAMPTHQYSKTDGVNGTEEADTNNDPVQLALFKYVGYLGDQEKLKQGLGNNLVFLNALSSDKDFLVYLGTQSLTVSKLAESAKGYDLYVVGSKGENVLYFFLEKESGKLYRKTVNGSEEVTAKDIASFVAAQETYLTTNLKNLLAAVAQVEFKKAYIVDAFKKDEIVKALSNKKLHFVAAPSVEDFKLIYSVNNEANETIAQIILDKKDLSIQLKDMRDKENVTLQATDLSTSLPPFLEKLNSLPASQQKVVESQMKLKSTFEDKGFQLLLSSSNLSIKTEPREDEYRYYYDVSTIGGATETAGSSTAGGSTGTLLGSVVIEKATGMIEVVDPKGANTTNLLFFEEGLKKKL